MVNTFLVDTDYVKSATKLDRARLGKQRVEAYQILNILTNLHILAYIFGIEKYTRKETKVERDAWIALVVNTFKQSGITGILITDKITYFSNKNKPVESGHFISGTGFVFHPAVSMWIGYEESLKQYINAHIDVWILRGYKNTMQKYEIVGEPDKPKWLCKEVIINFQQTLIQREIERNEPGWYIFQREFIDAWVLNRGDEFLKIASCLYKNNRSDWWTFYSKEYLLTFGKFEGFLWP